METETNHALNTPHTRAPVGVAADPSTWWKPGFCPNPKGRGKNSKPRLQRMLEMALKNKLADMDGVKVPSVVAIVNTAIEAAIAGDPKFAKLIFDAGIPKPEVNRNVTINNVMAHSDGNKLIDASVLTSPLVPRGDTHLLEEPQPALPDSEPKG